MGERCRSRRTCHRYREVARAVTACPKWLVRCKRFKIAMPVRAWSSPPPKMRCPRKLFSVPWLRHTHDAPRRVSSICHQLRADLLRSRVTLARLGTNSHISEFRPSLSMSAMGRTVPISAGRQWVYCSPSNENGENFWGLTSTG